MAQQFDLKQIKEDLMSNDRVGVNIPILEKLLSLDGRRLVLGGKLIKGILSPVLRIFPWIPTTERIKESSFDGQELRDALVYFQQPLDDVQSNLFLSLLIAPSVVELLESTPMRSLGAVIALHKAYRDKLPVKEQFDCDEHGGCEIYSGDMEDEVADFFLEIGIDGEDQDMSKSIDVAHDHGDGDIQGEGLGDYRPHIPPLEMEEDLARKLQPGSGGEDMSGADKYCDDEWRDESSDDEDIDLFLSIIDASPQSHHLTSDTSTVCESPVEKDGPNLESRVDDLEGRVDNLEEGTTTMPSGKRIRSGRDRAAWMRIKRSHMHDRDKWCKPGAVMGVFPRGIGPLNGSASIHKILQVVVYSTDPDTIEEFPAGADRSEWAPIVMIGEAPVALTDYSKYKRGKLHKKNSTVYVHLLSGRVEVCEGLTVPEYCFRLGTATAGHSIIGEGGFPYFQNTKGVCTAIENTNFTSNPVFPATRLFVRDTLRHAKLAKKKVKRLAKNHDGTFLKTIVNAVSSLTLSSSSSSSSPKPLVKHDITLIVTENVEDIGIALGITSNGERVEVAAVREGSSAASLGVIAGDRVKNATGWDNEGDKDPNRLLNYIQAAPRPLKIVIRHKGFAPANESAPDSKKGDVKNKKSK